MSLLRESRTLRASERLERPLDVKRWQIARLHDGLAPGDRIITLGRESWRTVTGWPLEVVWTRVVGKVTRLHVFYTFLDHAAWAAASFSSADDLAAEGANLLSTLAQARPIFEVPGITHIGGWIRG